MTIHQETLDYMPRKKKITKSRWSQQPELKTVDFKNRDGTVDEWVYDTSYKPIRPIQVTTNIRRRAKKNK
jgi:hypothetical protein